MGRNHPEHMAGLLWNSRPESSGMGGRDQSESPAAIVRIRWPESLGISGRNGPEYAVCESGVTLTELAKRLDISVAGVGYSVDRGEKIARENNYRLFE